MLTFSNRHLPNGLIPSRVLARQPVDEAIGQPCFGCRLLCLRNSCILILSRLRSTPLGMQ